MGFDKLLSVFTSVTTVVLVFDYWIIRKRKWVVPDLFAGGPEHIYWYFHGVNPRAWFAYIVTVIPSLRKSHCISLLTKTPLTNSYLSWPLRKSYRKNNRCRCQDLPDHVYFRVCPRIDSVHRYQSFLPSTGTWCGCPI
jgi:hypothetical protein